MIKLSAIKKTYRFGDRKSDALKGISLEFRKAEFVCVLGPSGCGKTTLLNIIGGLDRYDGGNLIVDGKSTKNFREEDWDTYRSKTVGFVFQSYNLISHQTVLENVETALSIGGISKEEKKKRAVEALCKVGLAEHLRKKPAQLSGGEMQRVAIARAIVNNPKMILADEPTGALDSKNSVLIMDLLKEISKDRLVVTVTHNAELAKTYATRTIEMKDGRVISDSSPYADKEEAGEKQEKKKQKHSNMSYPLAAKLSMKNLAGKKVRTILTSVAAAISILGISLVVACTNGLNSFIDKVQKDSMSALPVTVSNNAVFDTSSYISGFLSDYSSNGQGKDGYVMINRTLKEAAERADATKNSINADYIDYISKNIDSSRATYTLEKRVQKNIYKTVSTPIYMATRIDRPVNVFVPTANSWTCLPENEKLVEEQYDIVAGKYPKNYNELMLVTDKDGMISDALLASYFIDIYAAVYDEKSSDYNKTGGYSYADILETDLGKFHLVLNDDLYKKNPTTETFSSGKISLETYLNKLVYVDDNDQSKKWTDQKAGTGNRGDYVVSNFKKWLGSDVVSGLKCYDKSPYAENSDHVIDHSGSVELKITCIVKLKEDAQYGMLFSPVCYTSALNDFVIENSAKSEVVAAQKSSENANVVTDKDFSSFVSLSSALENLGYAELPTKINFYPNTLKDKDYLLSVLDGYNDGKELSEQIRYVDNVGAIMEVVKSVVNGVTAILLVLTSVSLVVSAIMIGIITYVSVLERTKEIGILRAVGARKKDVVRLFVTETGMIGLIAGVLGVLMTFIAEIPLNAAMKRLTGIGSLAYLCWWHALVLIGLSVLVTIAAGLIPSLMASKKDPVKALRSE